MILTDVPLLKDKDDLWTWEYGRNKSFSVKSCYIRRFESFAGTGAPLSEQVLEACAKIWRCDVATKVFVLAWRLTIDRLPYS